LAPGEALGLGAEIRMLESMLETYGEQKDARRSTPSSRS
jgi:hypothetical protein